MKSFLSYHHHHCIFVNLVNIMLSTVLCHAFLSEHTTFSLSMFVWRSCVRFMSEKSLMFFITVSSQVVFGLPIGLAVGLIKHLSACCAGVSVGSRSRCPNHVELLLSMVMHQILFSSVFVSVHISEEEDTRYILFEDSQPDSFADSFAAEYCVEGFQTVMCQDHPSFDACLCTQ